MKTMSMKRRRSNSIDSSCGSGRSSEPLWTDSATTSVTPGSPASSNSFIHQQDALFKRGGSSRGSRSCRKNTLRSISLSLRWRVVAAAVVGTMMCQVSHGFTGVRVSTSTSTFAREAQQAHHHSPIRATRSTLLSSTASSSPSTTPQSLINNRRIVGTGWTPRKTSATTPLTATTSTTSATKLKATASRSMAPPTDNVQSHQRHHHPAVVAQRLHPRTKSSDEKRRQAYSALHRRNVETALAGRAGSGGVGMGVDAQMLELLSEQFLNNNNNNPFNSIRQQEASARPRPKGRPDFVPGAMNLETMAKFRERQDVMDLVSETASSSSSVVSEQEMAAIAPYILPQETSTSRGQSKTSSTGTGISKGASSSSTSAALNGQQAPPSNLPLVSDVNLNAGGVAEKSRKRVVKNLPSSGPTSSSSSSKGSGPFAQSPSAQQQQQLTEYGSPNKSFSTLGSNKRNNKKNVNTLDLQKYYGTELLTADEEYSLGMKIQFLIKCEQVHEGLAASLMRLPTITEWAQACGFTDPDPTFVETKADDQLLRPAGSDSLFDEMDPNMFVGNGLAQTAGPGRGRGRVKKPPPLKLKDFYDDSEYVLLAKKNSLNNNNNKAGSIDTAASPVAAAAAPPSSTSTRNKDLKPINRGTVTQFVEMLLTAREAKQRMVQSNMRLVVSISRKYSNVGVSLQDLVQEGSLGLSRAAEKFEPKKGFKFSTYASWWIQQAVFRSIAYHSRTIRLPVHVHNLLNRIRKVRSALQRELSRTPTNEEIAEKLGMTVQKYNKVLHLTKRSISLEAPKYKSNPKDLGHESDDLLGDTISTISASNVLEDESSPEKKVDHSLFLEDLKQMLTILDDDERRVIYARYGLSDGLTRTVTTVAAQMKQSKAWVRSQECRALRKLRRPWYEKKLKEHQDSLTS